jgi:hypothetical protein
MRADLLPSQLYKAAWILWIAGTVVIIFSWIDVVTPTIGWIGFSATLVGVLLSFGSHLAYRLVPPVRHESLHHPLATFLPEVAEIPKEMKLVHQGVFSNAQAARLYPNAPARLEQLNAWGRTASVHRHYLHKHGCHPQLRLADLQCQVIHFSSAEGASALLNNNDREHNPGFMHYVREPFQADVGEEAYLMRFITMNDCQPPQLLNGMQIMFRRRNYVSGVAASAVQDTLSDEELQQLLMKLAQSIDTKLSTSV